MLLVRAYEEYNAWLQCRETVSSFSLKLEIDDKITQTVAEELKFGIERLFTKEVWNGDDPTCIKLGLDEEQPAEGYSISAHDGTIEVKANEKGVIYAVFALLRELATGKPLSEIHLTSAPRVAHRVINHWDRADGTIERGYAGHSIFFKNDVLDYDPKRMRDYARLLASIGINEVAINNVNVTEESAKLITNEMLPKLAELAAIFREYSVRLMVAVHFESPVLFGAAKTSDPLDKDVIEWWKERTEEVYRYIPDFVGYLVKADSEFRGGPTSVGRTQADGANMLARLLAPHNGIVYWRCFIYNCMQDWRDQSIDRPKAPYDLFKPQDGLFDDNVILQVKNGPSDFQVREPNSPLLGAMEQTREALELQIAQEYTGHQIDVYNLATHWEDVFASPAPGARPLYDLVGKEIEAITAVSNIGDDENWTGHTLAQLNLYAFGRLAWDPTLKSETITEEWIRLTFGLDQEVFTKIRKILLRSREAYEKYTTPLGLCWMVNVHLHYGPSPEGYEFMKWGTYHRANHEAIGVNRTSSGTGFTKQYEPGLTALYDSINTCPEELLLYFHRVPYAHKLRNGKTLIQHMYDTHFEGVEHVEEFIATWESLKEKLPRSVYESVYARLQRQLDNAKEWRDVINTYLHRMSAVPDEKGRKIYD